MVYHKVLFWIMFFDLNINNLLAPINAIGLPLGESK